MSKADKLVFGILAPLVMYVAGSWAVGITATGAGPSAGYRGMQLLFFIFPAGFVVSGLLNIWVLFAPVRRRVSAFLAGSAVPAAALIVEYAFLWNIGPFARG
ncbi:MAG: hypothetical protein IT529_15655 [Burkholderiales bacterium]|nr:hypothetical protein [Burkholderiales bacterium]